MCLFGPPFALVGKDLLIDENAIFEVKFNSAADQALVKRYEWYLDGIVISNLVQPEVSISVESGKHQVSVRILTAAGWSGIKSLPFKKMPAPGISLKGPNVILEGGTAIFNVIAKYEDKTTEDLTHLYDFSAGEGVFKGSQLMMPNNTGLGDNRPLLITAKRTGFANLVKTLVVVDTSEVVIVDIQISGSATILEGSSETFQVVATYSDHSIQQLSGYTFFTEEGTFTGNLLTIPENNIGGDQRVINIMATKANSKPLTKEITILDKPPLVFDEFDYLVLRFDWRYSDLRGEDLDIHVKYENNGTSDDNVPVGYANHTDLIPAPNYTVPKGSPQNTSALLWWAGDANAQTQNKYVEAVLVGIKNFINVHPTSPNIIEVGIYASWWGKPNDGFFLLEMTTYLGGTMQKATDELDFINSGGSLVAREQAYRSAQERNFVKVGILRYNKTTKNATVQFV